jgi:putative transcriptional regulator
MAIKVTLDRILLERRMSLTELADRVGVTIANLSILKTGKARAIRFSTLDALCRELQCQPGDIVIFEPGGGVLADEDETEDEAAYGGA